MSTFKNILFATDLKERNCIVSKKAIDVAKSNNATFTATTVIGKIPYQCVNKTMKLAEDKIRELFVKAKEEEIDSMVCRESGFEIEKNVLVGNPHVEIIKDVVSNKRDLVILSAKQKSKLHHLIFGSTAMKLIRYCPCPVWVMRPEFIEKSKSVMVALDFNIHSSEVEPFTRKVMETALNVAKTQGAKLHIFHSWFLYGESVLKTPRASVRPEELQKMIDYEKSLHQKKMDLVLGEFDLSEVDHDVHMVKGDPEVKIIEGLEQLNADLLIMGSVGRAGLEGVFTGNTAEVVLNQVDTAILTIKPDTFKTPIS